MTGFGQSEIQDGDYTCKAEIRSVNNRFIEINTRLPKHLFSLERPLKQLIKSHCSRGSFDVSISLKQTGENSNGQIIKPDLPLAEQYFEAFKQIKDQLGLKGEIDINSVLSLKDIVKVEPLQIDESKEELVLKAVEEALSALIAMREEEGENLREDIFRRLEEIEKQAEFIKSRQPAMVQECQKKLREKIQSLSEGVELDEARLIQETAFMADRCDVTEEIVRLESHLKQFKSLLETNVPQGRKLEFITQEINRETNTIGSKAIDSQISQSVIENKSNLEKIREQLQNIE